MFPLLGATHRLLLLHMDKRFIWNNETKKRINELEIGYNITPGLHINEAFRYRVEKCMNTTYGELTQPFIKATLSKNNTSVLSLITFNVTTAENPKKIKVLRCVIYAIIKGYVCIDFLDS